MPEPLEQPLDFDLSPALASISQLDDALQGAVSRFTDALTSAITDALATPAELAVTADTSSAEADLSALAEPQTIPVDADTSAAEAEVSALAEEQTVPIDADTSAAEADISVLSEGQTVPVDADVSDAQDAIASLEGETVDVSVEADTSAAQDAISGIAASSSEAESGLLGVENAGNLAAAGIGAATGSVQDLASSFGSKLGPEGKAATGVILAGTAALGIYFNTALEAEAANQRFAQTFGDLADNVNQINVGNLNEDLSTLALSLGADDDQLRNVASTLFLFQTGAGTSRTEAAKLSETVVALAARASALNPALGSADEIAGRLGNTLARGGRFLSQYGINITSTEIKARAAENAQRGLGDGVSFAALQIAGAQLASERYGKSLAEDIAKGTENPIIRLRALGQSFEETIEAAGQPLVSPLIETIQEIEPAAEAGAEALGVLLRIALPGLRLFAGVLADTEPIVSGLATGLDKLAAAEEALIPPTNQLSDSFNFFDTGDRVAAVFDTIRQKSIEMAPGIGAGIGVLRAASSVFGLFGGKAKETKVDVTALDDAFNEFFDTLTAGHGSIEGLQDRVEGFLKSSLAVGEAGKRGSDAAKVLGLSIDDIGASLLGTNDAFDAFVGHIENSALKTDDNRAAFDALSDTVKQSRADLQGQSQAAVLAARDQGLLTDAQVEAAKAQLALTGDAHDYIALLDILTPSINRAAHAQQLQHDVQFAGSAASKELQAAIADGTVTMASASEVAQQYGISVEEATRIISNSIAAQDRAVASTVTQTDAYRALVNQIAAGNITQAEGEARLRAMGFSADGATSAFQSLQSTISSAVSAIIQNLPTAEDAFSDFTSAATAAFDKLQQDIESGTGSVAEDMEALGRALDPTRFFENLITQSFQIVSFFDNIEKLLGLGMNDVAAFLLNQPIEFAAPFAAKLASQPNKAKIREAVFDAYSQITGPEAQQFLNEHAAQLGLDTGAVLANGLVVGAEPIGAAVEKLSADTARHFHPDFRGNVDLATRAAAQALANDPAISQAAGEAGLRALHAFEEKNGPVPWGQAAKIAVDAAHDAIAQDGTLKAGAQKLGGDTKDAFGRNANIKAAAEKEFAAAAALIPGLQNVPNVAGLLGVDTGQAFGQGLINGLDNKTGEIEAAGRRAGAAADRGARSTGGIDATSPSKKGIKTGQDYITGIVIGLTDSLVVDSAGVELARNLSSSAGAAFAQVGHVAVSALVEGFNDPATIANAKKTLQDLVKQAAEAGQAQTGAVGNTDQIVSSIVSALPGASAAVTDFGSAWSTAVSNQATAIDTYHAAYKTYKEDLADQHALQRRLAIAAGVALAAQNALNNAVASHAPEAVVNQLKAAAERAQTAFDELKDAVRSGSDQLTSDLGSIADATEGLSAANKALATASNPGEFIKNVNAQNRANRQFERDIQRLISFGDTDLAELLAQAGPEAAGKLAAGFANNKSKARMAEAAVDHANAFTERYTDFIEKNFTPKVVNQAAATGSAAGQAFSAGFNTATAIAVPSAATATNTAPQVAVVNAPAVPVSTLPQTLELDLTINMPGGQTLGATVEVPVPRTSPTTTKTRLAAAVNAKVVA